MVRLPEDKPPLTHQFSTAAPRQYDPFKAHEYYIRTRHLHPRKGGTGRALINRSRTRLGPAPPSLQKQRAEAAAQVDALQKKLSQLNQALKVALAKEAKPKKRQRKPTATDKSKKARQSKKYRQAHRQQLKTKAKQAAAKSSGGSGSGGGKGTATTTKSGSGSSTVIRAAITRVQQALAAAKARQRALG
jgi:hypothetical protein